jgi:hypothetical protein
MQRQAAAVRRFLRFFRLSVPAFQVGERYAHRLAPGGTSHYPLSSTNMIDFEPVLRPYESK